MGRKPVQELQIRAGHLEEAEQVEGAVLGEVVVRKGDVAQLEEVLDQELDLLGREGERVLPEVAALEVAVLPDLRVVRQ